MTPVQAQRGFTLVEVVLFLSLSGLVFLIGFSGISTRNQADQFTDSIRNLDSFLQAQMNDVFNGVNEFGDGDSGTDYLLGKAFIFDSDGVEAVTLSGTVVDPQQVLDREAEADPDRWLVHDSSPTVVTGSTTEKFFDWGTEFHSLNIGASNEAFNGFAIVRSPTSSRIFPLVWDPPSAAVVDLDDQALYDPSSSSFGYLNAPELYICMQGTNGRYAAIGYGVGERENTIEAYFDPDYDPGGGYDSCAPKETV